MAFLWPQEDGVSDLTQGWYNGKEGVTDEKTRPRRWGRLVGLIRAGSSSGFMRSLLLLIAF
jgi:hypothetical protein